MFDTVLIATDRNDRAEGPVQYRRTRERRFLERLRRIVTELAVPTTGPTGAMEADDIEAATDSATAYAIALARHHEAHLHVLFMIDSGRYDTTVAFAREPLVDEGEDAVERHVDAAERAGVVATGTVGLGRPSRLVLDAASERDVDLIVLNERSTGLLARLRGGLVPSVIEGAGVPVFVVPQSGHPD